MRILGVVLFLVLVLPIYSQTTTYIDKNENTQLWGPIEIEDLDTKPYQKWFSKNYNNYTIETTDRSWVDGLHDVTVTIFMGTWCSDSREWVPGFIKLWDGLGLDRSQIEIIALSDDTDHYKQSTGGEEMGLIIHRVPTFIFEKETIEIGRIVEYPYLDLEGDLKQISKGNAPGSNFRTADYIYDLLNTNTTEEIDSGLDNHVKILADFSYDSGELNKLGYVYLRSGMLEKAKTTFKINTLLFPNESIVYDSYGEALMEAGNHARALEKYQKVLELDPENKHAKDHIAKLKLKIKEMKSLKR